MEKSILMVRTLNQLVREALAEDIGLGDVTTNNTVPGEDRCHVRLMAKQVGVLSGVEVFRQVFVSAKAETRDWKALPDGARFRRGEEVASFTGNARAVLTAERTALNFLEHLSGIATLTAKYVAAVAGSRVKICDTRKTTPLLRKLEKDAVVHGGGSNHRFDLSNGILIKENHIAAAGGIAKAVQSIKNGAHHLMRIEVEVTSLRELEEALNAGAEIVLLDNMSPEDMRKAVRRARGRKVLLEASGNATLSNVRAMAETGVDFISVGALTHSAPAADLSLLITPNGPGK
jgi:nicotinate-nucleotide pyrophosphorylase (carboxylating)